jgi:hypothetical protein
VEGSVWSRVVRVGGRLARKPPATVEAALTHDLSPRSAVIMQLRGVLWKKMCRWRVLPHRALQDAVSFNFVRWAGWLPGLHEGRSHLHVRPSPGFQQHYRAMRRWVFLLPPCSVHWCRCTATCTLPPTWR